MYGLQEKEKYQLRKPGSTQPVGVCTGFRLEPGLHSRQVCTGSRSRLEPGLHGRLACTGSRKMYKQNREQTSAQMRSESEIEK